MRATHPDPVLDLSLALLAIESITPKDGGCQLLLAKRLEASGFTTNHLRFGLVDNLWAVCENQHSGDGPLVVFAGHTDVVPTGPLEDWHSPPFEPEIREAFLYARGAADMKVSLAAMVIAAERFVARYPDHPGKIAFLITSDEEGDARDGTRRVVEYLQTQNCHMDYCIVGEPSSQNQLGDTVRNGRRGSLGAQLTLRGKQGHVAYPHLAINPIHLAMSVLEELVLREWAAADAYFPATSLQISNIHSGTGVSNVIPGSLDATFNFRFNPSQSPEQLMQITESLFSERGLDFKINWNLSGLPFITPEGHLTTAIAKAIKQACGLDTRLSTSGGTSDGRFIAPTGTHVIEVGPVNATIHMVNECVKVDDLPLLERIYYHCLENLLLESPHHTTANQAASESEAP